MTPNELKVLVSKNKSYPRLWRSDLEFFLSSRKRFNLNRVISLPTRCGQRSHCTSTHSATQDRYSFAPRAGLSKCSSRCMSWKVSDAISSSVHLSGNAAGLSAISLAQQAGNLTHQIVTLSLPSNLHITWTPKGGASSVHVLQAQATASSFDAAIHEHW